jgi:transcriptional regulator with XRE-family HTH domain
VAESSIAKHSEPTRASRLAAAVGREVRRRRLASGLTQAELGHPLTRGYVSAVELGLATPSLVTLAHLVDRLGISLDEFFREVKPHSTSRYDASHGSPEDGPPTRR